MLRITSSPPIYVVNYINIVVPDIFTFRNYAKEYCMNVILIVN